MTAGSCVAPGEETTPAAAPTPAACRRLSSWLRERGEASSGFGGEGKVVGVGERNGGVAERKEVMAIQGEGRGGC